MIIKKNYVDTDLGQIHYRERSGDGSPIVCFHQTASSSAMFDQFMLEYKGNNPILALDSPGFGGSFDPEGQPTMSDYADIMAQALTNLELGASHLFGHHTGASVAVEIAARYPKMTKSLAMIGPVVITREEAEAFKQVYPKDFQIKSDGSHLTKMWEYVAEIGGGSTVELQHREFVDTARAWEGHIKVYSTIWDQDFIALYEQVTCPMLIMCSPDDILWGIFERAKELRSDAEVGVLTGSNFQPDECPSLVAETLKNFVAKY